LVLDWDQRMFWWPNSTPIHLDSLFSRFRYRRMNPRPFPTNHLLTVVSARCCYSEEMGIIFARLQSFGLGMTYL
jgi:hypothetical protein